MTVTILLEQDSDNDKYDVDGSGQIWSRIGVRPQTNIFANKIFIKRTPVRAPGHTHLGAMLMGRGRPLLR